MRYCCLPFCLLVLLLAGCRETEVGADIVDRMMPLGIFIDPGVDVVDGENDQMGIRALIALPNDAPLSVETMQQRLGPYRASLRLGEQKRKKAAGIDLIEVPMILSAPAPTTETDPIRYFGYVLKLRSDDVEKWLIGSVDPYAMTTLGNLREGQVSFLMPTVGSPGQKLYLHAQAHNVSALQYHIHWYVSDGELDRARSANVTWTLPQSGTHTIIAVMRVPEYQGIAFAVQEITVRP